MRTRSITLLLIIFLTAVVLPGCGRTTGGEGGGFALEPGDLLFQDVDGGPLCDAIETVTSGCDGANLSHVGVVVGQADGAYVVIEAASAGVRTVPLEHFLRRSLDRNGRLKVLVGRLKPEFRHLIPGALRHASSLVGKPYDKAFDAGNDAYYCSELVYCAFTAANEGKPLFDLQPMTFIDPATGATFDAWEEYFRRLEVPVPEGRPGINPGGISRAPVLTIVHSYGAPTGWKPQAASPRNMRE
jgi:hypothetical protein